MRGRREGPLVKLIIWSVGMKFLSILPVACMGWFAKRLLSVGTTVESMAWLPATMIFCSCRRRFVLSLVVYHEVY